MGIPAQDVAEAVEINGRTLRCQVCAHTLFRRRQGQVGANLATLFGFDSPDSSAVCFVCAGCGYVHWFIPPR